MKTPFSRFLLLAGLGHTLCLATAQGEDAVGMLKQAIDLVHQVPGAAGDDQRQALLGQALQLTREAPERRLQGHRVAAVQALQRAFDKIRGGDPGHGADDLRQAEAELNAALSLAQALPPPTSSAASMIEAARAGDLHQVVTMASLEPALVSQKDDFGIAPLQAAISGVHADVAEWLLDHGADPNGQDDFGQLFLHLAVSSGSKRLTQTLLAHKANANARDKHGVTPLLTACRQGHWELVGLLLENGADASAAIPEGFPDAGATSLSFAARNEETIHLLLAHGADLDAALRYAEAHHFGSMAEELQACSGVRPTAPIDGPPPQEVITRLVANTWRKPLGPVEEDVTDETVQATQGLAKLTGDHRSLREALASSFNTFTLDGSLTPLWAEGRAALFFGKAKLTQAAVKDYQADHPDKADHTKFTTVGFGPAESDFIDGQVIVSFALVQQHGAWKVHCIYFSNEPLQGHAKGFIAAQLAAFAKSEKDPAK